MTSFLQREPDVACVKRALDEWDTDWYGPNPTYTPARLNALEAVAAFERLVEHQEALEREVRYYLAEHTAGRPALTIGMEQALRDG